MLRQEIINNQTLYQRLVLLRDHLVRQIELIRLRIAEFPEGELYCTKNRAWTKWYVRLEGKILYLPKDEKDFAYIMADKKILTAVLSDLQYDLQEINQYLQHHQDNPQKAKKLLSTHSAYSELLTQHDLLKDLSDWATKPYESNPFYADAKMHTAPGNLMVRSKAEAMIATFLSANHIPFRYECALQLEDRIIYPDFTLRHPYTGEFFYWEHFGKMDDPEYQNHAFAKMQLYSKNEIQPYIQLIITTETSTKPLSTHTIECRIREFFATGQLDAASW